MNLTEEEKEYLLGLLEWQLANNQGLERWEDYHHCKSIMEKINRGK